MTTKFLCYIQKKTKQTKKNKHNFKKCVQLKMTITSKGQHNFMCGHFGLGLLGYEGNGYTSVVHPLTFCEHTLTLFTKS